MSNRNTVQLALIRDALAEIVGHASAEDVYAALTRRHPNISKSTVYNNLAKLAEKGEITRIEGIDSVVRYDINITPHYHFQCEVCDGVTDVDYPFQHNIINGVTDKRGRIFKSHTIMFSGICVDCAEREKTVKTEAK